MAEFIVAIGLVLFIEGLLYGGFPRGMKKLMAQMQAVPDKSLQISGFIAMLIGIFIVWIMH